MNQHNNPDGLGPQDLGFAVLASGSIAVVEANGDVSAIVTADDWWEDVRIARAEWERGS